MLLFYFFPSQSGENYTKPPDMIKKMFLSFIGLVFLAIIIDVALICGFFVLANSLKENVQASTMLPETTSEVDLERYYYF